MVDPSSRLLAALLCDEGLKARFRENPAAVLREQGIPVPEGVSLRVVEDTATVRHVVIPFAPEGEDVSVEAVGSRASKLIF